MQLSLTTPLRKTGQLHRARQRLLCSDEMITIQTVGHEAHSSLVITFHTCNLISQLPLFGVAVIVRLTLFLRFPVGYVDVYSGYEDIAPLELGICMAPCC